MNQFPRRLIIVVSDEEREEANTIATEITSNPADAATYSVPLSQSGQEPATHWACSTVASDAMVGAMQAQMPRVPSITFFLLDAETEVLMNANLLIAQPSIGEFFTFTDALALMDLQRVEPPMIVGAGSGEGASGESTAEASV